MTIQMSREDGLYYRQTLFDKARRVVIKVGSAILTNENGMNYEVIDNIAREIAFLRNSGREVILVSSGAVAAGRKKISFVPGGELSIPEKQALASIGQSVLMHVYDEAFAKHGQKIAQLLLTHSDLSHRNRYLNVRNTLKTLFKFGVIPIINENDTVSVEELRFGDNDTLGALVSNLIEADMFICLTDVVGLYNGNPHNDPKAKPIYTVAEVTPEIEAMAGNVKSALGTGGMQSKIRAAKMVSAAGGSSFIGPGREPDILKQLFSGELIGTFFFPSASKLPSRKHWIAYVLKPKGKLILDQGACYALSKNGKSLLPSGINQVIGDFGVGDSVECCDQNGDVFAVGLINYSSADIAKIQGVQSHMIAELLGFKDSEEVMHRDNLVLL
ncbi:glutamate 5-kinase [Desulfosediminicola sp.]|uniref:glutamate 5-kinase n=1 Tax=Desulfosediminicola sp. TaxID=2886825 RepID=UPI003AF20D44